MRKRLKSPKFLALITAIMLVGSAFVGATWQTAAAQSSQGITDGQKSHLKGVIIGRNGDIVTLRTGDNGIADVLLNSTTRVETATWWWAKHRSITSLTPGLRVEVWGTGNPQGQLDARKITFDSDDLKMAQSAGGAVAPLEAAQARLTAEHQKLEGRQTTLESRQTTLEGQQSELSSAQQQMRSQQAQMQSDQDQLKVDLQRTKAETELLSKRMSEMDEYETRYSAKVNFAVGKAILTAEGKAALDEIADKALATSGYLVEVAGFTDSTGKESANQALSRRRAETVIDYLEGVKRVPIRRVLTPAGFGETQPVADNSTPTGRAENRRAEVKVLVNRTLAKQQ
jgi:outer membrane protein OmpA-like peptidoglycan-associated protein